MERRPFRSAPRPPRPARGAVRCVLAAATAAFLASAAPAGAAARCIACRADAGAILAPWDAGTLRALRDGEIRTSWVDEGEGDDGRRLRAAMVVDAPPRRVWELLTAYARWPEVVPRLRGIEVRDAEEPVRLRHHVRVLGMDVRYGTVRTTAPRAGRIEARLDPEQSNDLETNRTTWQLAPLDDGARTLVEVRARLRTGWTLPGFLEGMLLDRTLPAQMRAFRDAIEAGPDEGRAAADDGGAAVAGGG